MIKKLVTIGLLSFSLATFAQKVTLIPSVGYAWRTAKTPSGISSDMEKYIKGLKNGFNFDISAYYNLNKNMGLGLKYSSYLASSSGMISVQNNNGQTTSGYVTTNDNITFFGPAFMVSNFNEPTKHKFIADIGLGVISYTTKTGSVKGKGSNLGAELNIAYQYAATKNVSIGPKLGLSGGTLNKMKFNGTEVEFGDDQKEGLGRVSLSVAAAFRF